MEISCLQFVPQIGKVYNNLNQVDVVLNRPDSQKFDLLVLPEREFSCIKSGRLQQNSLFLEPTTSRFTSLQARTKALKYECIVTINYPENVDVSLRWPTSLEQYNSAIIIETEGEATANHQKSHLDGTDEVWALEGVAEFYDRQIEGLRSAVIRNTGDSNPHKSESPWSSWEFAYHIIDKRHGAREGPHTFTRHLQAPDMETLSYWLALLELVSRAEAHRDIIVVIFNRRSTDSDTLYADTSVILSTNGGEVVGYSFLSCGKKELPIIDTDQRPKINSITVPNSPAANKSTTPTHVNTTERSDNLFNASSTDKAQSIKSKFDPVCALLHPLEHNHQDFSPATPNINLSIDEIASLMSELDISSSDYRPELDAIQIDFKSRIDNRGDIRRSTPQRLNGPKILSLEVRAEQDTK